MTVAWQLRRLTIQCLLASCIFFSCPNLSFGQSSTNAEAQDGKCSEELCNAQDSQKLRAHAWKVFSYITQAVGPRSIPRWDTWHSKPDKAVQLKIPHSGDRRLEYPLEIVLPLFFSWEGQTIKPQKFVEMISTRTSGTEVKYNPHAFKYLNDNNLFDVATLDSELKVLGDAPLSKRDIRPLPAGSIIVKAFWLKVPKVGRTTVEIWNSSPCTGTCLPRVTIVQSHGQKCNLPATSDIFSSCFYHVDSVEPGVELILVGLHVMTKELPDWTWSTFWWHPSADVGVYASNRPQRIAMPWKNYLMNTTINMETPWEFNVSTGDKSKIVDECGQNADQTSAAKICFNPFLEIPGGGMENADSSNCMNCHKRAAYPVKNPEIIGSPRRGFLSSENRCFEDTIRLDYLWSVSHFTKGSPIDKFLVGLSTFLSAQ